MPLPTAVEPPEEAGAKSNATSDIAGQSKVQRGSVIRPWSFVPPVATQSAIASLAAPILARPVA